MKRTRSSMGAVSAALSRVYGNRDPKIIVKSFASDLLYTCKVLGPPFSPFEYAKSLNLEIEYRDMDAEGVFVSDDEGSKIILKDDGQDPNSSISRRVNFTLGHEIGHYMIRRAVAGFLPVSKFRRFDQSGEKSFGTDVEEERLCDIFAAELLMPGNFIGADFRKMGYAPDTILFLAAKYHVSLKALLCRAAGMSNQSLVGILWDKNEGEYFVNWSTPWKYRNLILCDTGNTTVERAFETFGPQYGLDSIILDGRRMKWQAISRRLSFKSDLVLTLFCRPSTSPYLFPQKHTAVEAPKEHASEPVQLQLSCMSDFNDADR